MNTHTTGAMDEATAVPPRDRSGMNIALWVLQVLLAALFVFAGVMKLMMPAQTLAEQTHLPGALMQFVSVCEVVGGLALIVPGVMGRWRVLTPLAAVGLVLIMIGAVAATILAGGGGMAAFPLVIGLLCALAAWGRRGWR